MTDPYLEAHRLGRHAYAASGLAPVSLRDQILRGLTLVHRLRDIGLIGVHRPLLVIGAGAAGVSAALAAAEGGVPTTLFDLGRTPFRLQRQGGSRYMDPAAYDWPVDHWPAGDLACGSPFRLPLPYRADYASRLAMRWTECLDLALHDTGSRLTCVWNADVTGIATTDTTDAMPSGSRVMLADGTHHHGAALIWAASTKTERTGVRGLTGAPFWGPDALPQLDHRDRVLVSGAGDGALQDALRALTGTDDMAGLLRRLRLPAAVTAAVQSAEDRAGRVRVWLPVRADKARSREEAACLAELDRQHRAAAALALRSHRVKDAVLDLAHAERPVVSVVHRGDWLTAYYGLNRFLALLLDAALRKAGRPPLLHPRCEIAGVTAGRSRWRHAVTFKGASPPRRRAYSEVVVRHGYDDDAVTRTGIALPPVRSHLLPYRLP